MNSLISLRNLLLFGTVIITLAAIPVAQQLTFDQTIESFFAPDNPDIQLLSRSRADFGGDEFVIVAWPQPGLLETDEDRGVPQLSEAAAARITELADQLNTVPGINPEQTRHLVRFLEKTPRSKNTRSALLKLFEGVLLGRDGETTAVVLQLRPAADSPEPRRDTLQKIREIAARFDPQSAVAGEPVQIHDMFEMVEHDGRILYLFSLIVLSGILVLTFRGIRWMAGAIGVVMASVVCTRAALVLAGSQLSMVSSMLDSLVTVIAVATAMHLIVYYRELRKSTDQHSAAVQTMRELWSPVFWSMVTTAVGFSSLMISDIVPVRSFALMMTVATGFVLLFLMTIAPAMLASGSQIREPGRAPLEDSLDRILSRAAHAVEKHPVWSGLVCLLMMVVSAPGLMMLTVETDFSRNFRDSSPIVQSLRFVESRLGGAGTWEVAFNVPDQMPAAFLSQTRELTDQLEALSDAGVEIDVVSLNDAIDMPPRIGDANARLERLQRRQEDLVGSFYNPAARRMRIVLRSPEQRTAEVKLKQIEQVRSLVVRHFADQPDADATASGLYVLLAHLIESLLSDQLKSFLITSSGILLSMTIALRSLRLGLISLLPNVFPVVLVIGTLGVFGIPINIGTAMIASVSMGLTVDSTIHYITAFERARANHTIQESLQIAHGGAGRAVVLAYLALVAGFLVLTVSAFIPLVYFGALLSLSMVGGLVGDLILLPLMLRWLTPANSNSVRNSNEPDQP